MPAEIHFHSMVRSNFTMFPNTVFWNERFHGMTWKAVGLYAFLLSPKEGKKLTTATAIRLKKDGRDGVHAALQELEELGLLRRVRNRDADGRFTSEDWFIYGPEGVDPQPENPDTVHPDQAEPDQANPHTIKTITNKDFNQDKTSNNNHGTVSWLWGNISARWNEYVVPSIGGGSVQAMHAKRASALRERLKDKWWMENWEAALMRISDTPFLCGAIPTPTYPQGYRIGFDTFVRPATVARILEGFYDQTRDESVTHKSKTNGQGDLPL